MTNKEYLTGKELLRNKILVVLIAVALLGLSACSTEITAETDTQQHVITFVTVTPPSTVSLTPPDTDNKPELLQAQTIDFQPSVEQHRQLVIEVLNELTTTYNFTPDFILAVINQESQGYSNAQSTSYFDGASGLIQIANFWAKQWSENMPNELATQLQLAGYQTDENGQYAQSDIETYLATEQGNLTAGVILMNEAATNWSGNIYATLAEYNGGYLVGELWQKWSEYAMANNLDLFNYEDKQYLTYKEEAIQRIQELYTEEEYPVQTFRKKISEANQYVKLITKQLETDNQSSYLDYGDQRWGKEDNTIIVYVVQPGDTLFNIAQTYNTTIDQIIRDNPDIEDPNVISVGDKIMIY